jgi:hypothetical protein
MDLYRYVILYRRLSGFLCVDCAECFGLLAGRVCEGEYLVFCEGVQDSVWKDGVVVV